MENKSESFLLKKLKNQSEFAKNVWTLMTGSAMSQIILIAFSPILTRLYSPEEFGVLAVYMGIVSLVGSVSSGRYDFAILNPRKYFEALSLLVLSLGLVTIVTLISLLTILFFFDDIVELMHIKEYTFIIYFIPISIFITAVFQIFIYWNNRNKNFKLTSYGNISKSIFVSSLQTLAYKLSYGLILGQLIGNLISALIMAKTFIFKDSKNVQKIGLSHIKNVAVKYKNFPMYNLPHSFLTSLRISGVIVLISLFFGNTIVGLYSLALRALVTPVSVISKSVGDVFYQKIASLHSKGESIYNITIKTIKTQFMLSLPMFIIIYLIAPKLFSFVFGKEWIVAGNYVQALTPYIFFVFIITSVSSVGVVLGKQKGMLYFGIIESLIIPGIFIVGNYLEIDFINILYILSALMCLHSILYLYWLTLIIKNHEKG